ncbi:hypothetical protein FA95DRAFT_1562941 [Auriscalpium vulgare]|uniref:Uncharacterized protein n=1 Tax=Auriscalpium vulgare TaxID=40419 RepID=A0ACB8RIP6_9AGAM|nr:hypothetical protein FA95DRAFT_1562941 [Auriscalpium vulgare]
MAWMADDRRQRETKSAGAVDAGRTTGLCGSREGAGSRVTGREATWRDVVRRSGGLWGGMRCAGGERGHFISYLGVGKIEYWRCARLLVRAGTTERPTAGHAGVILHRSASLRVPPAHAPCVIGCREEEAQNSNSRYPAPQSKRSADGGILGWGWRIGQTPELLGRARSR